MKLSEEASGCGFWHAKLIRQHKFQICATGNFAAMSRTFEEASRHIQVLALISLKTQDFLNSICILIGIVEKTP